MCHAERTRYWIVVANNLDVSAVPWSPGVCHEQSVERQILRQSKAAA